MTTTAGTAANAGRPATFGSPASFGSPGTHGALPAVGELALYLFAALVLLFARAPRLLLQGRILAEEGTTYLRYAWNAAPLRAFIAPHQGYYSLLDNLAALIAARLLPLSAAALFFTWTAAAVQLLLIFLALQCEVFRTPLQRWLALFALLLVTPNFEVWLNLANCQSILTVAAAVILISSTRRLFVLRAATLAFAAFTTVATAPLIPLFWVRVWQQRSRRALIFALSITLPAFLQTALLLHAIAAGDRPTTSHQFRALVAFVSSRVVVLPFATGRGAQYYDRFLVAHSGMGWTIALDFLCFASLVLGFFLFRRTSAAALLLYFGALLSSAFGWYGCFHCTYDLFTGSPAGQGRYFFPANSMLFLALLLAVTNAPRRWLARALAVVFAWLLFTGAIEYFRTRTYLSDYPAWLPQVRRWQADERVPLMVAPSFWTEPLHLHHQHPNRTDLPADAYDSITRHHVWD